MKLRQFTEFIQVSNIKIPKDPFPLPPHGSPHEGHSLLRYQGLILVWLGKPVLEGGFTDVVEGVNVMGKVL